MHNESMIYGYARVSTAAQDETEQVRQLKAAGCEKVFREKITGTTADRPQLAKLMKALAPGDVVIIPAVDHINDRWGEFVVTPALMMGMEDIILDRISFGGVKELRELYEV